ncbi:hypothetical protein [Actinoplanes aureus]|uniref:Uncharacterized protein n=1 Tax=Actinoplanes aureus TaxID=2792083 RepID=A0A931CMY6_9ACTN|nr:hypothetical protein [Actinoplanes aureus]MBG0569313.1 hypothetical protein [Actinoplanes aureus]
MTLMLPRVLVSADLVGSSGFRAQVGAEVSLALEIYCRHRVRALDQEPRPAPARRRAGGESADELVLTGVAVPFERTCPLGGWVLDVAGIPTYIIEASEAPGPNVIPGINDRDPDSDPEEPFPNRGAWVQVRGNVSVADGYVVDEIEQALQRSVERPWLVERIVRLVPAGYGHRTLHTHPQQVEEIRHTGDTSSYLLDLVTPATNPSVSPGA